CMQSLEFPPTF
nr:immunoglobulin light chain junction region [Macaca mulatta]MOX52404.1 immunoglobulin light chain junction region [Macaca mulatta]